MQPSHVPKVAERKSSARSNPSFGMRHVQNERQSKARVADGSAAASAKFAGAKAIFATNAVKYHVNKLRAKAWAAETGQVLHHAIAKDRISSAALREKPDLGKEKLTWLQRHDQDCGSLYGVLPLCIGMPVAAADHLDRSRGILRGCAGEIVGWVWPCRCRRRGESRNDADLERVAGVHLGPVQDQDHLACRRD